MDVSVTEVREKFITSYKKKLLVLQYNIITSTPGKNLRLKYGYINPLTVTNNYVLVFSSPQEVSRKF